MGIIRTSCVHVQHLVRLYDEASTDIVTTLTNIPSTNVPSLTERDPTQNNLLELATQLNSIDIMLVKKSVE